MRIKKTNGKLYKVEVEEPLNDKYKLQDFLDYLQEFGLEDEFNRCKTEDERYDIYMHYIYELDYLKFIHLSTSSKEKKILTVEYFRVNQIIKIMLHLQEKHLRKNKMNNQKMISKMTYIG